MGRTGLSVRALIGAAMAISLLAGCAERAEPPDVRAPSPDRSADAVTMPEDDGVPARGQSAPARPEPPTGRRQSDLPTGDAQRRAGETLDEDAALEAVRTDPDVAEWLAQFEGEPGYRTRMVVTDRDARLYHVRVEVHRMSPDAGAKPISTLWYEVDRNTGEVTKIEL